MRKHRGLSAVIGSVFLVAVVISSLTYITYSMNVLGNFSESLMTEEQRQKDKQSEAFSLSSVGMTNTNKLDGVVANSGNVPLKIKSLWIQEVGVNSVQKFNVNATIAPGNTLDLISKVDFDMDITKGYDLKIISDRGQVQTFHINSVGSKSLYLTTRTIPEVVSTEFDTTVLVTVTNNSTNNSPILNLTPSLTVDDTTCAPTCSAVYVSGPTPTSYPSLNQGDTATFSWVYTISGVDTNKITFTSSLTNGVAANTATATVEVRDVVSAIESGTALASVGLSANSINSSILIFHQENDRTPSSAYQMFSADSDGGSNGLKIDLDTAIPPAAVPHFFTQNYSSSQIIIPAGNWITSLRLQSEAMPFNLKGEGEDMIFHFNKNEANPDNSEGTATADLEGCNQYTYTQTITDGKNDVEEKGDGAVTSTGAGSDKLEMGYKDATWKNMDGLRFTNIPIPKGATIQSAYIQFASKEAQSATTVSVKIRGEAADSSAAFTDTPGANSLSSRGDTTASVNWSSVPAWTALQQDANTKTPEIKTIIQEIVNRSGWAQGNALLIEIEDNGGTVGAKRNISALESGQNLNPTLTIVYGVSAPPTWDSTAGVHASGATAGTVTGVTDGAYRFDGVNDCLRSTNDISSSDGNDIQAKPDSTALWFKTAAVVGATDQHLVSWGGAQNHDTVCPDCDNYKIFLEGGTGKLYFWFNTEHTGAAPTVGVPTDITRCKSTNRYDNSLWYHVVAVRDSVNDNCKLNITNFDGTDAEIITNATNNPTTDLVDADGRWVVGANEAETGNYFNGWIDDVVHWGAKSLDATEADELSHANYGTTAHTLNLSIDRTDENGVNVSNIMSQTVNVPFYDPKGDVTDNLDSTYGVFNVTSALGAQTMLVDQRLNFTLSYVPSTSTWKALELDMKTDDQDITPESSLLQIPPPDIPFPSYWIYDKCTNACPGTPPNRLTVSVFNVGPYGVWFVYQGTRAVFDDPVLGTSYSALICSVNSTQTDPCTTAAGNDSWRVMEDRDSIFIPVGSIGKVYFWSVQDRPDRDVSGGTLIPAGNYDMHVFVDGYDEKGGKFSRNIELGRIKVQD